MEIKFTKMHGCGNDYIYMDGMQRPENPEKRAEMVRRLSDRHFGIGGDGVIWIHRVQEEKGTEPGQRADLRWRCTMRTDPGQKCVGTGYAVWLNMYTIKAGRTGSKSALSAVGKLSI